MRRSRRLGSGGASRPGFRRAGQAGGRQPCCAPGRPGRSRSGGHGAKPSRRPRGGAEWAGRLVAVSGRACHPQQRVRADRHGQAFGQALACLAAQRQPEVALQVAQPLGPACGGRCGAGQAFGKALPRAGQVQAAKPPRMDVQRYRPTLPGQAGQQAATPAMRTLRHHPAIRIRSRGLTGAGHDGDVAGVRQDLVGHQAGRDQRQPMFGQERLSGKGGALPCAHPTPKRQHGKGGRTRARAPLTADLVSRPPRAFDPYDVARPTLGRVDRNARRGREPDAEQKRSERRPRKLARSKLLWFMRGPRKAVRPMVQTLPLPKFWDCLLTAIIHQPGAMPC